MKYIKNKYSTESLLIGVSGGQDSICLIRFINNFNTKQKKYKHIDYIYIDHQWTKESKKQAEYVISYLKSLKNKVTIYQIRKTSLSEKIARTYRYHTIIHHAIKYKYKVILTAHTETDKIETFFLNLIRGTTIEGTTTLGLCRMINQKIVLARPLIYTTRQYIKFTCRRYFLPLWSDSSNYNYSIKRNRVRNELIPYLRKYYNKKLESNMIGFLSNCKYNNEYIKKKVINLYLQNKHKKYIALNYKYLKKQHSIIQVRVMQIFLCHSINLFVDKSKLTDLISKLYQVKNEKYFRLILKNINVLYVGQWIFLSYSESTSLNK